jgi:hypothetical protein
MLAVFMEDNEGQWVHLGNTEIIFNQLNPQFETKIMVPYNNQQKKSLKFEVYHVQKVREKNILSKQKLLGEAVGLLNDIVFKVEIKRIFGNCNCSVIKRTQSGSSKSRESKVILARPKFGSLLVLRNLSQGI